MNSDRWLALLTLLAVFVVSGCGDSGEKKPAEPPALPVPQNQPKSQKAPPPGTVKMH
jgi:hypothetical protein